MFYNKFLKKNKINLLNSKIFLKVIKKIMINKITINKINKVIMC